MATTQEILSAASDLGKLISSHESAKKIESVAERLQNDLDAQRILNDYNRHMKTLSEKEANGSPIEVDDKRQLEGFHQQVIQNPILRDLQIAQMDYLDLMRKVDEALRGQPEGADMVSPIQ